MKFHLSNISTGEGHAWRWAPNKTPDSWWQRWASRFILLLPILRGDFV